MLGVVTSRSRHSEFEALAERAQPLVDAIGRYQQDHGGPPGSLTDLVPLYSPAVPKTGHALYPDFEYEFFDPGVDRWPPVEGVTWELRVPCSLGFGNWDAFFYWPSEDYPEQMVSGSVERIGRWAYLHE